MPFHNTQLPSAVAAYYAGPAARGYAPVSHQLQPPVPFNDYSPQPQDDLPKEPRSASIKQELLARWASTPGAEETGLVSNLLAAVLSSVPRPADPAPGSADGGGATTPLEQDVQAESSAHAHASEDEAAYMQLTHTATRVPHEVAAKGLAPIGPMVRSEVMPASPAVSLSMSRDWAGLMGRTADSALMAVDCSTSKLAQAFAQQRPQHPAPSSAAVAGPVASTSTAAAAPAAARSLSSTGGCSPALITGPGGIFSGSRGTVLAEARRSTTPPDTAGSGSRAGTPNTAPAFTANPAGRFGASVHGIMQRVKNAAKLQPGKYRSLRVQAAESRDLMIQLVSLPPAKQTGQFTTKAAAGKLAAVLEKHGPSRSDVMKLLESIPQFGGWVLREAACIGDGALHGLADWSSLQCKGNFQAVRRPCMTPLGAALSGRWMRFDAAARGQADCSLS